MKKKNLFTIIIMIFLVGCLGYRVGTLLPAHIKSIAVPTFKNSSPEPDIEIQSTNAVIKQLKVDGTLKVVSKEQADVLLRCEIIDYKRTPLHYTEGTTPSEYRITIVVSATLTDLKKNEELWANKIIRGNVDFRITTSLPASEREALPDAIEDLAHDIVEQVVEGWE